MIDRVSVHLLYIYECLLLISKIPQCFISSPAPVQLFPNILKNRKVREAQTSNIGRIQAGNQVEACLRSLLQNSTFKTYVRVYGIHCMLCSTWMRRNLFHLRLATSFLPFEGQLMKMEEFEKRGKSNVSKVDHFNLTTQPILMIRLTFKI